MDTGEDGEVFAADGDGDEFMQDELEQSELEAAAGTDGKEQNAFASNSNSGKAPGVPARYSGSGPMSTLTGQTSSCRVDPIQSGLRLRRS